MTQTLTAELVFRPAVAGGASASQQQYNDFLFAVMSTDLDSVFFNGSDFNEFASYYHNSLGTWETYNIDFDNPSTTVDFGSNVDMSDLKPQIMIPNNVLLAPIRKEDKVRVRGTVYLVEDVNNDGVGVTTVYLRRP